MLDHKKKKQTKTKTKKQKKKQKSKKNNKSLLETKNPKKIICENKTLPSLAHLCKALRHQKRSPRSTHRFVNDVSRSCDGEKKIEG